MLRDQAYALLGLDDFDEDKHPRGDHGRFAASGRESHVEASKGGKEGKEFVTKEGHSLPAHIQGTKIPPAWTNVTYATDPKAELLVTGKDAKGRPQAIYSKEYSAKTAAEKFARVKDLSEKADKIKAENDAHLKSADPEKREAAACAALVMATGIRPGGTGNTGAEKQAYGATTLEGRHVSVSKDGKVTLNFVGKKGVNLKISVEDAKVSAMLVERKEAAGNKGKLFQTSESKLLDHVHTLNGGSFKTKDFRTLLGTKTAMDHVEKMSTPKTEKEYKKSVMTVAKAVSAKLGNTPNVALQAYINPSVFSGWRSYANVA